MKSRALVAALVGVLLVSALGCSAVRIRVLMNEGNKLYKAQKYEAAIKEYQKIVAIDPNHWLANYQIAVSYLALYHPGSTHPKDLEYASKSIAAYERVLGLPPPDKDTLEKVRSYYVSLLTAADKGDKAIEFYEKLLRQDPRNPHLMVQLAQLYAKKGDADNALKWFEKRAEVEPNNKEAWYTIGVVCWERCAKGGAMVSDAERQALIDKGLKALDRASQLDPDYFEAILYVSLLWRQQQVVWAAAGNEEGAQQAIAKAEEIRKKALEARDRKKKAAEAAGQKG